VYAFFPFETRLYELCCSFEAVALISNCYQECVEVFQTFLTLSKSGGIQSAFVDVYNAASNSWARYPEGLVQARSFFAATSIPSGAVFFAGGQTSGEGSVFDNITASPLCM
jgi:hypothetical protein